MSNHDDDFFGGMFDFNGDGKTSLDEEFIAYKIFEESCREEEQNEFDEFDDFDEFDNYENTENITNPYIKTNYSTPKYLSTSNPNNNFNTQKTYPNFSTNSPNRRRNKNSLIFLIVIAMLLIIGSLNSCIQDSKSKPYSSSYSRNYRVTTTAKNTTATTARKTTTTYSTTKYKKTTTTKSDPYNAKKYDDPEDFYEDYYDDFFDYEDAEDYYYDNN